jgi:predicted  nucleic acid-binding Zn-ribbon protein
MDMNKTLQNISRKTADCAELYLTLTNRIPVLKRQIKVAQELANSYSKELEKLDTKFATTREWEDMADDLFNIVDEAEDNASDLRYDLIETEERLFDMEDLISEAYGSLIGAAGAALPNR